MTEKPLRGVLVGAGYFAGFQAEAWPRVPGVELVAVADAVPGKARAFADRYGVPRAYESAAEALDRERPDFVDVATRPESHLDLTRLAAERGVNVVCQKPMAPAWADCVAMVEACEAARARLLIHENWRWQPWYREAKRLLDAGALGRVVQVSFFWRTGDGRGPDPYTAQPYFARMPRLLIYETLVHLLDTYRFLLGGVEHLSCETARLNPAVVGEDHALIHLKFAGGALGLIDGNRVTGPVPQGPVKGTLLLEGDEAVLRVSPDGRLWLTRRGEPERRLPFDPPTAGYLGDSVFATQAHLIESLRTGRPSESDGRDYLKTVALVEACYRAAATGTRARPDV
jgi:predicted dehydrogenase